MTPSGIPRKQVQLFYHWDKVPSTHDLKERLVLAHSFRGFSLWLADFKETHGRRTRWRIASHFRELGSRAQGKNHKLYPPKVHLQRPMLSNWALPSSSMFNSDYLWINPLMSIVPYNPVTSPRVTQSIQIDKISWHNHHLELTKVFFWWLPSSVAVTPQGLIRPLRWPAILQCLTGHSVERMLSY